MDTEPQTTASSAESIAEIGATPPSAKGGTPPGATPETQSRQAKTPLHVDASLVSKLEELLALKTSGILSDEDFQAQKRKLIYGS